VSRERLLASAASFEGLGEEPKGSNRSTWIDAMLRNVGADLGSPWCAAFIAECMTDSAELYGASRPFLPSASVQEMVDDAKARGQFTQDASLVQPGDLVVYFHHGVERWGHIGIVQEMRAEGTSTVSIDGNTVPDSEGDSREGWCVAIKTRVVGPHTAFLIWPAP
jgi:hypothetical protein